VGYGALARHQSSPSVVSTLRGGDRDFCPGFPDNSFEAALKAHINAEEVLGRIALPALCQKSRSSLQGSSPQR
jgi:hypothetical protein